MITRLKGKWIEDKWFRTTIVLTLIGVILGFSLHSIWGLDPNSGGKSILGSPDATYELPAHQSVFYSVALNTELNSLGFASNAELDYFVIYEIVNSNTSLTYLKENATIQGRGDHMATWLERKEPVTFILNNTGGNLVKYRFELKQFESEDYQKLVNYQIGTYFYDSALIVLGMYLIWNFVVQKIPFLRRDQSARD